MVYRPLPVMKAQFMVIPCIWLSFWEAGGIDGGGFADCSVFAGIFCWLGLGHFCMLSLLTVTKLQQPVNKLNSAELAVLHRLAHTLNRWGWLAGSHFSHTCSLSRSWLFLQSSTVHYFAHFLLTTPLHSNCKVPRLYGQLAQIGAITNLSKYFITVNMRDTG